MTSDNTENMQPRYTLRPTFTPLPQRSEKNAGEVGRSKAASCKNDAGENVTTAGASPTLRTSAPANSAGMAAHAASKGVADVNSVIRAANEDDDLYDPYSDYRDGTLRAAEFEKDPWR